jgi:hypothetical protein
VIELRDETTGTRLATNVQGETIFEPTMITNTALDGTTYIQIIGDPIITYEIRSYLTRSARNLLENAKSNGDLIAATLAQGTVRGRVLKTEYSDRMAMGQYLVNITLVKEATAQ